MFLVNGKNSIWIGTSIWKANKLDLLKEDLNQNSTKNKRRH
jgi:hypothetical protein